MFLSNEEQKGTGFQPHPKGPSKGVCVEVITVNKKTGQPFTKVSKKGEAKQQLILVFQTEKKVEVEEGVFEHCVHWEWFNVPQTLQNENSKIHKFLNNWEVPIKEYPTQSAFENEVLGRPAYLVFTHNKSDDGTKVYSNLTSCSAVEDPKDAFVATDYKPYSQSAA